MDLDTSFIIVAKRTLKVKIVPENNGRAVLCGSESRPRLKLQTTTCNDRNAPNLDRPATQRPILNADLRSHS
jgi:hypothetical protein